MNYYINAEEQLESAIILAHAGKFRPSATMLCLACELFLKYLLEQRDSNSILLNGHDLIKLGAELSKEPNYVKIAPSLRLLRKYLNYSRYPFNPSVYTKQFCDECLEIVMLVKDNVDLITSRKPLETKLNDKFNKNKAAREDDFER